MTNYNRDLKRGIIGNRAAAMQIKDFSDMRWGNITPTDIDGLMEYKDKAYIIFELKYGDTELPFGQRLALQRLYRDLKKSGKHILGCVASHRDSPPSDIAVEKSVVTEIWDDSVHSQWRQLNTHSQSSLYETVDNFLQYVDSKC